MIDVREAFQKKPTEMFYKKGFLKTIAKFAGKYQCQSFFNIVASLRLQLY